MDNHVHIVLKADIKDMSVAFKKINVKYAMSYNKKQGTIGHVFQDRYKSQPIETDEYLMQVIRYVHNNPIQASMVKELKEYKWSSYNEYNKKGLVDYSDQMKFVLKYFNDDLKQFKDFHKKTDDNEYLEIKEDLIKNRINKAKNIVDKYCNKYGVIETYQLFNNREIMDEMVKEIIKKSGLSFRKIAEYLGVSFSLVQQINLKSKQ